MSAESTGDRRLRVTSMLVENIDLRGHDLASERTTSIGWRSAGATDGHHRQGVTSIRGEDHLHWRRNIRFLEEFHRVRITSTSVKTLRRSHRSLDSTGYLHVVEKSRAHRGFSPGRLTSMHGETWVMGEAGCPDRITSTRGESHRTLFENPWPGASPP